MFVLSIFLRRYRLDVSCDSWILSGHAWFTCFFSCYTRICRWIASTADLWFYAVLSRAVLVRQVVTWERLATTWKGFFIFSRCITDSNGFQRLYIRMYTPYVYIYIYTSVATRTFWQLRISQGRMQNRWELLDDNTVESCVRITQLSEAWSKKGVKADRTSGTNTWQTSIKETQAIELCIFFIISTFQELLTPGSGRFHDLKSMEAWLLYRFVWNPFLLTKWCKKGEQCRSFRGESYPITKAGSRGGLKSFRRFAKFVIFFCVFFVQQKTTELKEMLEELKDSFSELSDNVGIYAQLSHEVPLKKSPHGFHRIHPIHPFIRHCHPIVWTRIMSSSYVLLPDFHQSGWRQTSYPLNPVGRVVSQGKRPDNFNDLEMFRR